MRETRLPIHAMAILGIVLQLVVMSSTRLAGQQIEPYRPDVGETHADFKLPSIEDGAPVRLSDFRGRKLLLFHFASW